MLKANCKKAIENIRLKEIDRKNYIQGFLRFDDLEKRAALDKKLEKIIRKYTE